MASIIKVDQIQSDTGNVNIASNVAFTGSSQINSPTITSPTITGNVNIDSGVLFVDGTNNRVGAGTSNPVDVLDIVSGSSTYPRVRSTAGSAAAMFFQNSDTGTTTGDGMYVGISSAEEGLVWNTENTAIRIASNNTERIRVAANGYVGVGTTTPSTLFHVVGEQAQVGTTGGNKGVSFAYDGGSSCPLYFGGEIDSAQKSIYLYGYWMYIRGHSNEGIRFVFSQSAGSAPRSDQYEFKYNSATRPTGSTTWDGFSDVRAKENVRDMNGALNIVGQLRPVRYDWTDDYADATNMFLLDKSDPRPYKWISVKENGYDTLRKNDQYGFIAQEFEEVFPHDVKEVEVTLGEEKLNDFKTVNYDSLIPVLTKAIQELKEELDTVKAELAALKGQ